MKNFIEVFDNALSSEDCKYIIDYMNTSDLMKAGNVSTPEGGGVVENYKISTEMGIDIQEINPINDIISSSLLFQINKYKELHPQLEQLAKWGVQEKYNLQKYEPNQAYFKLHCENAGLVDGMKRVLAWMFYLNTVTDDGGTYFDNYDLTLNAVEGRCVIWPAYWTHMHRGIVSKTESKYIVTGWFSFIDNV
tara:strand:- start:27 stop:602 length:576 start_codon:yes stop_codon:yes gene_type:complete